MSKIKRSVVVESNNRAWKTLIKKHPKRFLSVESMKLSYSDDTTKFLGAAIGLDLTLKNYRMGIFVLEGDEFDFGNDVE